jgi:Ni,Fe-hydrogenase I large subunit
VAANMVTIDPVTRIEGKLRVSVEVTGNKVTDAWISSTMFRGLESIITGHDPLSAWHFGSRVCGVCPNPHAINGIMATERAMGIDKITDNGRLARNMIEALQRGYDHILWFYQLGALDYVNVPNALKAKPKDPALKELAAQLTAFVSSGQLGPFANHWWDHPAYKLPPDLDLALVGHYLEALKVQQRVNQATASIAGKFPMIMSMAPGGVIHLPQEDEILQYLARMQEAKDFIDNVMLQDLLAIAPYYAADLAGMGKGTTNYLTWGVLDEKSQDPYDRLFPRGAIVGGDLTKIHKVDPKDVKTFTKHSYYSDATGMGKAPLDTNQEQLQYTKIPETKADYDGKYSWSEAVRLSVDGKEPLPMEVGPLSAVLVAYASGRPEVKMLVDTVLGAVGAAGKPQALFSTLGRVAARVIIAKVNADNAARWATDLLANYKAGNTDRAIDKPVPDSGEGYGGWDAPRGALVHYMRIKGGKIGNYAMVPASNWNLQPRDDKGTRSPVEEALIGTTLADPNRPLEVLRTIRSFDP